MANYRVVVAGCGGMANTWVDYALKREDIEIVGLVDIREESAAAMKEKRGLNAAIFTDLQEALEQVNADIVFDVTIPASHKQVAQTAFSHGCHLFGEKPLAESMEDARGLIEQAESADRHYAIMQNRRYNPQIRAVSSAVKDGTIGSLGAIHADFFLGAHFGGFRDLMDNVLLLDMAIHTFDEARFISGADPVSVYCHEFNLPGSWYEGNASAVAIYEMSDGSVFCYRGSWSSEGFPTSWESDWRVIGSKGTILWNGKDNPVCEVVDESKPVQFQSALKQTDIPVTWNGQGGHHGCLDEMFASLKENRPAETEASDNVKSLSMVLGAIESAKTGAKVKL